MKTEKPSSVGVVISTYNSPEWLRKVLWGYESQLDQDFTVLIADDGSGEDTRQLLDVFRARGVLSIEHFWQPDDGFQKTKILNKVVANTDCDYLIFTDGDCIPRNDFVQVHRSYAQPNRFLSGGYLKLTMPVSEYITEGMVLHQKIFQSKFLKAAGQPLSLKFLKLVRKRYLQRFLNLLSPAKASWNGMNSSGWRSDILAVNGFDERMQYGGEDREMGERLINLGLKPMRVRYSAICVHLEHSRGYVSEKVWAKNRAIREQVEKKSSTWTEYGVVQRRRESTK